MIAIGRSDPGVKVIAFTRNFGQMPAILAGLRAATGDLVLQLSADLQDPAELIPQMLAAHVNGSEVVIALFALTLWQPKLEGSALKIFQIRAFPDHLNAPRAAVLENERLMENDIFHNRSGFRSESQAEVGRGG